MGPTSPKPNKNTPSRRRLYFIIFSVLFVILIPVLLLYATGYRISSTFTLVPTGGISLTDVTPDMQVYINYQPQKSSAFFDETFFIKNLLPGNYFVVAAKDGYWSWAKNIEVSEKKVTVAPILLLPEHPELRLITQFVPVEGLIGHFSFFASSSGATSTAAQQTNSEYTEVAALFAKPSIAPNALQPRVANSVSLWLAGPSHEDVMVGWNGDVADQPSFFPTAGSNATSTFVDYQSSSPIKTADFFPLRDDVVILQITNGVSDGLYALELDTTPQQNYEPIYLSSGPIDFRISPEGKLYVRQGSDFYQVMI